MSLRHQFPRGSGVSWSASRRLKSGNRSQSPFIKILVLIVSLIGITYIYGSVTGHQLVFSNKKCGKSIAEVVTSTPRFYGKVAKHGPTDLNLWYPTLNGQLQGKFDAWLLQTSVFSKPNPVGTPAPLSAACTVLVNHKYKFIFIKNTKTAGTSVFLYFGGYCKARPIPGDPKANSCVQRFSLQDIPTPEAAQKLWKEYFVFTIERNPYDRAGSSYSYMLGRRGAKRNGTCLDPPFREFCRDPTVVGKQDRMFRCLDDWVHDFYHVEPQAQCVTTAHGKSAVDYIIRYSHLQQDFDSVIKHINNRKTSSLAALPPTPLGHFQKGPAGSKPPQNTTAPVTLRRLSMLQEGQQQQKTAKETGGGTAVTLSNSTAKTHGWGTHTAGKHGRSLHGSEGKQGKESGQHVKHMSLFLECGHECVHGVAKYYSKDVDFFQYPVCASSV